MCDYCIRVCDDCWDREKPEITVPISGGICEKCRVNEATHLQDDYPHKNELTVGDIYKQFPYGRIANIVSCSEAIAEYIVTAGHGPYLEIGVLHAGSMVINMLERKKAGIEGKGYGLDPFDGYYPPQEGVGTFSANMTRKVDPVTNTPVTMEVAEKNLSAFGIYNVELIQGFSWPTFPESLKGREYAAVMIDGEHNDIVPLSDWNNIQPLTRKGSIVVFHDYNKRFPGVIEAVEVAKNDKNWRAVCHIYDTVIVRKI